MMVALSIFVVILTFSGQSLFTRLYSAAFPAHKADQATPVFSIVFGVFIAVASFLLGGMSFAPSWETVVLALLTAAMLVLYNRSMIEAGNRGSYSFLMIAAMFGGILVPIIADVCFLGKPMAAHQIVAVLLMLVSMVLMNARGIDFKGASRAYYLWCFILFLANGLFCLLMGRQAAIMEGAQRTEMLTIVYGASALVACVMGCMGGKGRSLAEGFRMGGKSALFLLLCCIAATTAANLQMWVLSQIESAGVYYTIADGGVLVVSILLSLALFKERPRWEQVIGMVTAIGSIALINI